VRTLVGDDPDPQRFARAIGGVFQPWVVAHMSAGPGLPWVDAPPILSGSVTFDRGAEVYASGKVSFGVRWADAPPPLMPWGGRLRLSAGVRYPSGAVAVAPLGTYVVWETAEAGPRRLDLTVCDEAALLREDRLESPRTYRRGTDAQAVAEALAGESVRGAVVTSDVPLGRLAADLLVESDRLAALRTLGEAVGAWGAFVSGGRWHYRADPTEATPAVAVLDAGRGAVSVARTASRDGVRNVIVARGENTEAEAPSVQGRAADGDPASATWVAGPFGRAVDFYSSPLLTTPTAAAAAARTVLARRRARVLGVTVGARWNPVLEPGDIVTVVPDGGAPLRRVITKAEVPLTVSATMGLTVAVPGHTGEEPQDA
jgi:hypothetical protein